MSAMETRLGQYARRRGMSVEQARVDLYEKQRKIARVMDSAVRIPLVGGVGLDAVLGLVPIAGDVVSKFASLSLIFSAAAMGAPGPVIRRMATNSTVDLLIGSIPVAGDVFDLFFRANQRNLELTRAFMKEHGLPIPPDPPPRAGGLAGVKVSPVRRAQPGMKRLR